MAWTAPRTWQPGDIVTAAQLNEQVRDNLSALHALVPIGTVLPFAGAAAPDGWALCEGQAVSRTDHAALFAVVGSRYGAGDGITTFGLPDLRGRAVIGAGAEVAGEAPRSARALGAAGGAESVTLTIDQIPAHTHQYSGAGGRRRNADVSPGVTVALAEYGSGDTEPTGGGQPAPTMPPWQALAWIIRVA